MTIHQTLIEQFGGPPDHAFLVGLLERGESDLAHLHPWLAAHITKL